MKTLLTGIIIFICLPLQSQVVNQTHMPVAGDTIRYLDVNPVNAGLMSLINQNGQNQTWNFNLTPLDTVIVEYKSSSKTPYAFYFFNTVGLKIADSIGFGGYSMKDVYQFYSKTSASYKAEGLGFRFSLVPIPLAGNYSDEDEIYFFPLSYGKKDSSTFMISVSLPLGPVSGTYIQKGHRITEVVGSGKIILNKDTLNCLKVKSKVVSLDSVKTPLTSFGFPNERVEYKWVSPDKRGNLVEVSGAETGVSYAPAQARYAYMPDKPAGPGVGMEESTVIFVKLYPNPAAGLLYIDGVYDELILTDLSGKVQLISRASHVIDISSLLRGIYIAQVKLGNKIKSVKIVVGE